MLRDLYDNPVSTTVPAALDAVDEFARQFLGYGQGAGIVLKAAEADPGWAYGQALAAGLWMFMESPAGLPKAKRHAEAARSARRDATDREAAVTAAILAWVEGDMDRALALHEAIARDHPRDIVATKIGQYHYFNRGDGDGILRLADAILPEAGDVGFVHGMRAFGLEQTHRLAEAEEAGRHATAMNRADPWAHHAVAHVMETQGRVEEGIAWMTDLADTWDGCNSFMLTHNWWHTALFHIDREAPDAALDLYDTRVWGVWKDYSQDQINAVSLLARLELAGLDVGDRWQDVADHLMGRTSDQVNGFLDLQYLYGLARAERQPAAEALLENLRRKANAVARPFDRLVWAETVLPAAEGLMAYAAGAYDRAADRLGRARQTLVRAGGSHAQRDLFEQIWLDALERAGRREDAAAAWRSRADARPTLGHLSRRAAALGA